MSITGFDDAIRDNVKSYSNNLEALRATNVMARNNALAGLQSEVEKYGEMAKLGLEIPVAVEGLKQVGGRAKDLVNFVRGAPARLEEAKAGIKGAVDTALSRGREAVDTAKEAVNTARGSVGGAAGDIRDTLSQRLDNLRTTSAYGGRSIQPGEQMGSMRDLAETKMGESKIEFNPTARIRENAMRSTTRPGIEMTETDDMNYFDTQHGAGGDFSYGGQVSSGETKTSGRVRAESDFTGFEPDEDEYGFPKATQAVGEGEPSLFSHEEPRFSTQRGLDAGFENDRMGLGNMGRAGRGAPLRSQSSQGYNELSTEPRAPTRGAGEGDYQDIGENRGAGTTYSPPGETKSMDSALSNSADQTAGAEASSASNIGDDAGKIAGDVVDSAAASTGGEVAGGLEEGLGAGLLASGIFAPLGALLEGIGAVTEVGSVGAGVYGAVQSFSEQGQEEALRNTPLPTVRQPTLDLGGRVAAPVLA